MSRGNNIYHRKDGRWEGRYILCKKEDGKPHFGYVYGTTFREVQEKLLPLKYAYSKSNRVIQEFTGTFTDWAICWLEEKVKTKIKSSTYGSYQSMLQGHILPYLGNKKLISIVSQDIQDFVEYLKDKGLSADTIHNNTAMAKRIFNAAVKNGVLLVNPFLEIELPKKVPAQIEVLTIDEQQRLEEAAMADKDGIPVMIALYSGMRIGEICGLRWEDIDFNTRSIHVNKTVQRIVVVNGKKRGTKVAVGDPKSSWSNRRIPMSDKLQELLLKEAGLAQSEYVITCKDSFAEPHAIRSRYKRIAERAAIRPLRFHGLRHTFATRCLEANIDIPVISKYLGHKSAKMTMDIYLNVTTEHMTRSIRSLDHIYDGQK